MNNKKDTITVQGTEIVLFSKEKEDYMSLTDIAKYRDHENPSQINSLWLRTYSTIEYIGLWEKLNNPNFKPHIYEGFKNESAKPHFWMSAQKWINETNAIGMISKSGRYGGGTFAHSDIALFGKTAQQWRSEHPDARGNIRDDAALEQLVVLSNMESINALLIRQGLPQGERLVQLNRTAITQLTSLVGNSHIQKLTERKR
ncbi:MAG: KilA-N domain-containing protein [Tannerellaceae bacterium]|jgi:hypothetical protein|nr:KilA-N domain-containing protein [Tannerellaceae bacterium]